LLQILEQTIVSIRDLMRES
jgi:dynein heavy chain, axonemal